MALKIRLRRVGAKKQPAYRIVIADARAPRDGRIVENIGAYNPLTHPSTVTIDSERALYWMRNGAQVTDVVKRLFVKNGIWSEFTGEPMPEVVQAPVVAAIEEAPVVEEPVAVVDEASAVEEAAPIVEAAPVAVEEAPSAVEEAPAAVEEASTPAVEEASAPAVEEAPAE